MRIDGKVVLITGASEGIGAACVDEFRRKGAKLSLTARSEAKLAQVGGSDALVTPGDVTDPAVRQRIVDRTLERFGRLDILLNNAGKGIYSPTAETPLETIRSVYELNLFAPLAMIHLAVPVMRAQGSGMIVNVGSIAGKITLPWLTTYCGTKFALGAMTDGLRMELRGTGIHAMTVCPGYVKTGFQANALGGPAPKSLRERKQYAISPQRCASDIVRGVEREARTVMSPASGWLAILACRMFPGIAERQMARMNRTL
jgi:short-subunit dehydrogenase